MNNCTFIAIALAFAVSSTGVQADDDSEDAGMNLKDPVDLCHRNHSHSPPFRTTLGGSLIVASLGKEIPVEREDLPDHLANHTGDHTTFLSLTNATKRALQRGTDKRIRWGNAGCWNKTLIQ